MERQKEVTNSPLITLTLEILPYSLQDADPALINAVGHYTADWLSNDGCIIKPIYTGQRGGFFIDVIIPFLATIWTNKDIILADSSALVTILTPIALITKYIRKAHEKHIGKHDAQQLPIKITVEIDGHSIAVEASDLETANAALTLARRYEAQYPNIAAKITLQSKAKVNASVANRKPRKRR